jgi:crotonobetainyl-CoA hydratase
MSDMVTTTRHGKVLEIVFDRPPVNAINRAASAALYDAFAFLRDDDGLAVGIVTGGGDRIFSAGWDLKEVAAGEESLDGEAEAPPGGFAGNTELWDLHKPLIAAVNGLAIGGGFELALGCDLIIAADHAAFSLPEMQRGFLADAGAMQRLPRRLPYHIALEMLLTGRSMDAREAARWGLVNKVVPAAALMDEAHALAARIAEGAPLAIQACLEVLQAIEMRPLEDAMKMTKKGQSGLPMYEKMMASQDAIEGPVAFAEKRKPNWKGR